MLGDRPLGGPHKEIGSVATQTCAACDCTLDDNRITVKIGGKTVEVCCQECADSLKEANASRAKALNLHDAGGRSEGMSGHR